MAAIAVAAGSCALAGCGKPANSTAKAPVATSQDSTVVAAVALKSAYMAQFRATVLVDGGGFSLYVFGPDHRRAVTCTAACALSWPPLTVPTGTRPSTGPASRRGWWARGPVPMAPPSSLTMGGPCTPTWRT